MENVYPFVEKPGEMPVESRVYRVMEKLNNGGSLTTGTDDGWDGFKYKDENGHYIQRPGYDVSMNDYVLFSEVKSPEAYRTGIVRLMGYEFNFRAFFKPYLVLLEGEDVYRKRWAPDEGFVYANAANPDTIQKIIWLDENGDMPVEDLGSIAALTTQNFASRERMAEICAKALDALYGLLNDYELYGWLSQNLEMTDDEIRAAGFDCVSNEEE